MLPATATLPYEQKLALLREQLAALPGAVVAFSAGVDSTALLHACHEALGDRAVAVTADSPSLPRRELAEAGELAATIGARHVVLETDELARDGYRANESDRCYHCKKELFVTVAARRAEIAPPEWVVVYGAITDDLGDHRPGQAAAEEHGVRAPLVDCGFAKPDVRRYARDAGLSVADKPSFACLSSRVPYGVEIDREVLAQVERAGGEESARIATETGRALLLCWPVNPGSMPWDAECLAAFGGDVLLHVGELEGDGVPPNAQPAGGQTTSAAFQAAVRAAGFERAERVAIPRFPFCFDALTVFKRSATVPNPPDR